MRMDSTERKMSTDEVVDIKATCADRCMDCFEAIISCLSCSKGPVRGMEIYRNTNSVFLKVDSYARKIFPFTFLFLNLVYWTFYVYII